MTILVLAIALIVTVAVGWLFERVVVSDGYGHNTPPRSRQPLSDWHQPGTPDPVR